MSTIKRIGICLSKDNTNKIEEIKKMLFFDVIIENNCIFLKEKSSLSDEKQQLNELQEVARHFNCSFTIVY